MADAEAGSTGHTPTPPGAANPHSPHPSHLTRSRRPYVVHKRPLFFAHRGGSSLAPENTLIAFERGLAFGADALELDIQTTSEGELVVIHDPTLDRTTNGVGLVDTHTLDELRRFDAGYRFTPDGGHTYPYRGQGITIPTLREILEQFPQTRINIDLKESSPARERRLWETIQEYEAYERVLVASGDLPLPIIRFRQLAAGRVATSASASEVRNFVLATVAHATRWLHPAYDALQVPEAYRGIRVVSHPLLTAAHRLGLDVHVWTVDATSDMKRLLALGVDGLMTDRPDLLAEVLGQITE